MQIHFSAQGIAVGTLYFFASTLLLLPATGHFIVGQKEDRA
jgi:hypothetical protein